MPLFPKPKQAKRENPIVKKFRDGRTRIDTSQQAGRDKRDKLIERAWRKQGKRCSYCRRLKELKEVSWDLA